ncbi:hypothetical protein WOLCODRAFT_63055 [Wolfiporia cocos MD-104 SS10]|uniref:DUF4100 domain-containing protein n=1 Tax=Wolfiporia cocos (strain MD-104) TaxID=742152 RepID=A0A2H3IT99_WOLCO|nr:hypothetical protein WOLCODRAFT_63055 [Wolfiporia cocos MD-104 SS10]
MSAGSRYAPKFDGKNVTDFLSVFEAQACAAGIPDTEWSDKVLQYCKSSIRQIIKNHELFKNKTWTDTKKVFYHYFPSEEEKTVPTPEGLREFSRRCREDERVNLRSSFDRYVRNFALKEGDMVMKGKMTKTERDLLFYQGLPVTVRHCIADSLRRKIGKDITMDAPPDQSMTIEAVRLYFSRNNIEYSLGTLNSGSDEETSDDEELSSDESDSGKEARRRARERAEKERRGKKVKSKANEKDEQAEKLAQLSEALTKLQLTIANQQVATQQLTTQHQHMHQVSTGQMGRAPRMCFMCGKTEGIDLDHPIGMSKCPETIALIAEKVCQFSPATGKVIRANGGNLLMVPAGQHGGIAAIRFGKGKDRDMSNVAGPSGTCLSLGVLVDGEQLIEGDVYTYSSRVLNTFAATRAQAKKSTVEDGESSDEEPIAKRFEYRHTNNRSKGKVVGPSEATKMTPTAKVDGKAASEKPPAVNTEEGWKTRKKDQVTVHKRNMPPHLKQTRFTSDVQDMVSADDVTNQILDQKLTLQLRQIIGISPTLQKRFAALTKTRKEVGGSAAQANRVAAVEDEEEAVEDIMTEGSAMLSLQEGENLEEVITRYTDVYAVAVGQERFFAMACGVVQGMFRTEAVMYLVDSGSELNLISKKVWDQTNLAIDPDGHRWTLKGINGMLTPLEGCIRDAPVEIGGERFDHHFFVTPTDLGQHDGILGQPWLQWVAANLEYERKNRMYLVAHRNGDRSTTPIRVRIVDTGTDRNKEKLVFTTELVSRKDF